MDAIFYHEGRIRPAVAAVKSLASALAIGSGSAKSVAKAQPIIQIGASLGSSIGGLMRLPGLATYHTCCGGSRRRYCLDVQYPDRRCHLCNRIA